MRRLHPATIIIALVPALKESLRTTFPVLIGAFFSHHAGSQDWIAGLIAFFTASFAVGAYWTTRFDIEPDQVVHRTGWIFRKDRRIPLAQIQNVNLRQSVLERLFKVATVDIETAMGRGRDMKLTVLGLADAERFREEVLGAAHLNGVRPIEVEEPVVRLTNHDLLLGAITENHFAQVILAFFTVGGTSIGFIMTFADKLPRGAAPLVFSGALLLLVVGGWIWGAVGYYFKFGGFVVHRNENIFRISYGLLNKVQIAIRPGRIEYVQLATTLPQRFMGRTTIRVGTASTFGDAGVLAPVGLFVPQEVAFVGAAEVIPGLDLHRLVWHPFEAVFYQASIVRSLINLAVLAALFGTLNWVDGGTTPYWVWMIPSVIGGLSILRLATLFLARPENGYAITEGAVVTRTGYFHQYLAAMPISRIENVSMTQPWWWRRRNAARLSAQAMKQRIHIGALSTHDAERLLASWRKHVETREMAPAPETYEDRMTPLKSDDVPV